MDSAINALCLSSWHDDSHRSRLSKINSTNQGRGQLRSARLSDCHTLNDAALLQLVGAHPRLTELDISFKLVPSPVVSTSALLRLPPQLPLLRRLNLSYLEHVTDAVVVRFAEECNALEELRLACCLRIGDAALFAVAEGLAARNDDTRSRADGGGASGAGFVRGGGGRGGGLTVLDLHMDDRVSDAGLQAVARACPLLRELDAAFLRLLTDGTVDVLVQSCPG